jgi:UDP-N-acetylmuramoylalanine--D-glutamate ligase
VAKVLRERGEQVIGVDAGTPPQARELAALGVELHLQEGGAAQLAHLDLVGGARGATEIGAAAVGAANAGATEVGALVKSPGVPAQTPVVAAARERGIPVLGELELAWRLLPNEFIAVTGTNGKTTTVEWIGHIHREAGLAVAVAGNVGAALSGLVGRIEEHAIVVCEASSFQLEDTLAFAPEAAVLLNITPDHLDRHGTMEAYRAAKLQVFARQKEGDIAVVPAQAAEAAYAATHADAGPYVECALHDGRLWWQGEPLLGVDELSLRGAHNAQNALAAAAVCLARGIDLDAVRAGLRSFAGVPHRLQEVARRAGVAYVNDSKATNVASTRVALAAFREGGVHLILGGQGKGQDFAPLREPIAAGCRAVYLIGEDASQIAAALGGIEVPLRECGDLGRAVATASAAARPGETVLLSPACASFDQFADFEARGEQFVALVAAGV